MIYFIIAIAVLLLGFNIFLFILNGQILKLEQNIRVMLKQRTSLIPALYDVSRNTIIKHDKVFQEIIHLRKMEFFQNQSREDFLKLIDIEYKIHLELNFIFRVIAKHPKFLRNERFIYIRELIINISFSLAERVTLYKKIIAQYNTLISINRFCIVGLFLPIQKIANL